MRDELREIMEEENNPEALIFTLRWNLLAGLSRQVTGTLTFVFKESSCCLVENELSKHE